MSDHPDQVTETGGKSNNKTRGRVSISPERCKGCGYCVEFCPTAVLVMARGFNAKGYHYPEIVDATKCTGCDLCGMFCPDFAVVGERISKKK
jgi:2-oxoglutarate ferredoxin oxidoreductase subunit delta